MLDRTKLLGIAIVGVCVCVALPSARAFAGPSPVCTAIGTAVAGAEEEDEKKDSAKHEEHEEKDEHGEHEGHKEIEQNVPMEMVPGPIIDAVKKELPDGKITEAELVAKHHKIVYSFDVQVGPMTYDVEISVDGKFVSKEVDDDEKDGKDEKDEKKPEMSEKK